MKSMKLLLLLVTMMMAGCAKLGVKVDILDKRYFEHNRDQAQLRDALHTALSSSDIQVSKSLTQKTVDLYRYTAGEYKKEANQLLSKFTNEEVAAGNALSVLATEVSEVVDEIVVDYFVHEGEILEITGKIQSSFDRLSAQKQRDINNGTADIPSRIIDLLTERNAGIRAFHRKMTGELESELDFGNLSKNAILTVNNGVEDIKTMSVLSLEKLGAFSLAQDENASIVAGAEERYWHEMYNEAHGLGAFGNVDIAVKMESIGDYTVKGLNFDPGEVPNAIGKATVQAISLLAASTGVPLAGAVNLGDATSSSADAFSSAVPEGIAMAVGKNETQKKLIRDYRNGLAGFALLVTAQKDSINKEAELIDLEKVKDAEKDAAKAENAKKEAEAATARKNALVQINSALKILESTTKSLLSQSTKSISPGKPADKGSGTPAAPKKKVPPKTEPIKKPVAKAAA